MTIETAFYGFLAADADARVSKAGKPWVRLRVGVCKDDALQWVQVNVFGTGATTGKAIASIARAPSGSTLGAATTASNATPWPWPHSNASGHTKSAAPAINAPATTPATTSTHSTMTYPSERRHEQSRLFTTTTHTANNLQTPRPATTMDEWRAGTW
jgi:hypothetical protein